jgi:hypothetical protein
MDVSKFLESDYVTVQFVKDSLSKTLVIVSPGAEESFKEKAGLTLAVQMDGKMKKWKTNKASLTALVAKHGKESSAYVGKTVSLTVQIVNGKESVIGVPA